LGALSALALIGLLALGDRALGFPFVPFDIFDWMSRTLPGGLIRFVIHSMVAIIVFLQDFLPIGDISTASKLAEQSIAILQLVLGGAILGGLLAWIRRKRDPTPFGQIGGLVLLAITLFIEISLGAASVMARSAASAERVTKPAVMMDHMTIWEFPPAPASCACSGATATNASMSRTDVRTVRFLTTTASSQ